MGTLRTLKRRAFLAQVCLRACALLATAFCFLLFRQLSGITCLFKLLTGISCPTCGMSGAVLALCRGDLAGYIASNAFAVPVGALLAALIIPDLWKQKPFVALAAVTLTCNLAYYVFRMATGTV